MRRNDREREKEIRTFLKEAGLSEGADWLRPEEGPKQETLALLRKERMRLRLRPRKTFLERLFDQASWLSPGSWLFQAAALLFFCVLLKNTDYARRDTLLMVSACTPLFGIAGLVELLRSWQNGMWELEECCRYHLRQIQGMRLLVFGIVDCGAAVVILGLGVLEGYTLETLLLFFLFPLLVSDGVFLLLAKTFRRGAKGLVPVLAGFCMGIFWTYHAAWIQDVPWVFKTCTSPLILTALLFLGVGLLVLGCVRFLNETGKEEQKLWNCV